jgi:hypothetical protein
MGDKNYGQMLAEGFVRAIPWAIVFSAAFVFSAGILVGSLRQEVKEAVEYTAKTAVRQSVRAVMNDPELNQVLWPRAKQLVKEGIEYTITTADRKLNAPKAGGKK